VIGFLAKALAYSLPIMPAWDLDPVKLNGQW